VTHTRWGFQAPLEANLGVAPYRSAEELAAAINQADREMCESKARHRDLLRLDPIPLAAEPS
jgi:hypothetical protein